MDVAAPKAGVIKKIFGEEGDTVEVGAVLAIISVGASASSSASNGAVPAAAPAPAQSTPAASNDLSPAPRRVVAERGIDPAGIAGTGKGRPRYQR